MKKGFTLAEVLITLAIIGIVAAITIPGIVKKYSKHKYYTQFLKTYNAISSAMDLAIADNGNPSGWTFSRAHSGDTVKEYIYPYFKVSSECEEANASQCLNYPVGYLRGNELVTATSALFDSASGASENAPALILADGSIIYAYCHDDGHKVDSVTFKFDTNGKADPNIMGRDIFTISFQNLASSGQEERWGMYMDNYGCDYNDYTGRRCPSKLLREGKMDY